MQRWLLVLGVLLLVFNSHITAYQHFDWAYAGLFGPSLWSRSYPSCGGSRQSPINVNTKTAEHDKTLKPFIITLKSAIGNYKVENLGLNTEIFFEDTVWEAKIEGEPNSSYTLHQIHFHWGSEDGQGSEHTIDDRRFPIEAHIVMWNSQLYPNVSTASSGANGLAVLSILFEIDNGAPVNPNPVMECIVTALMSRKINQCPCRSYTDIVTEEMRGFDINQLLPRNIEHFYRYEGSLTTPPCTENVLWTIYRETVYITEAQIKIFRRLKNRPKFNGGRENMCDNFRPVQPLNRSPPLCDNRKVLASFDWSTPSHKYSNCRKLFE